MPDETPLIGKRFFPSLRHEICHCTDLNGLEGILKRKAVLPNIGDLVSNYEKSKNSVSHKYSWISLFDFGNCSDDNINMMEHVWGRFFFDRQPVTIVIVFERSKLSKHLVNNEWAHKKIGYGANKLLFIPHVEVWHKGEISTSAIKSILVVGLCGDLDYEWIDSSEHSFALAENISKKYQE